MTLLKFLTLLPFILFVGVILWTLRPVREKEVFKIEDLPDEGVRYFRRATPLHVHPDKIPRHMRWVETDRDDERGIPIGKTARKQLGIE